MKADEYKHRAHAREQDPQAVRLRAGVRSTLTPLVWVLAGLGSLASVLVALWVVLALTRSSAGASGSSALQWASALAITVGTPLVLALWKHQHRPQRIMPTMLWLPLAWNTGGLLIAVYLIPSATGTALREQGPWVLSNSLGDSHSATRVLSSLSHRTADAFNPEPAGRSFARGVPNIELDGDDVEPSQAISVALEEQGTAISVDVALEGYEGRHVNRSYLFDTGASYTTISTKTAAELGIAVPKNAPILSFDTAKGRRDSKMVYLPALRLGQVRIEGLLASVCDPCTNESHAGLLGQNAMRRFLARIDFRGGRMVLVPRRHEDRPNRAYDIAPMVELEVEGTAELWGNRLHWVVAVRNRGTVPIHDVVPTVRFTAGPTLAGQPIQTVDPGQVGKSLVKGAVRTGDDADTVGRFKLGLSEAYW